MHISRYTLRNKRLNIAIHPKENFKRNVQLLELMSRFDEDLLQRAEPFNMNSFIYKTHILSINMRLTVYRKIVMFVHSYKYNLIHILFVCMCGCVCVCVLVSCCFWLKYIVICYETNINTYCVCK